MNVKDEAQMLTNMLLKLRSKQPMGKTEAKWVLARIEERLKVLGEEVVE